MRLTSFFTSKDISSVFDALEQLFKERNASVKINAKQTKVLVSYENLLESQKEK